jgi:hypothetical protein
MLDTFIKTKGISKTIIHNNNKNYYDEVDWDADYDGNKANISLHVNDNGRKEHIEMKMDNDDLAKLLIIPSENKMLDKRLYNDFLGSYPKMNYKLIEIPKDSKIKKKVHFNNDMLNDKIYTHISSPFPEEDILFPLTIHNKSHKNYKQHRKPKTNITRRAHRTKSSSPKKTLKNYKISNRNTRKTF